MESNKKSLKLDNINQGEKTFREIIKYLGITDEKRYFTKEELISFFDIYRYDEKGTSKQKKYIGNFIWRHRNLMKKYPDFECFKDMDTMQIRRNFTELKISAILLLYILTGRIKVDNTISTNGLYDRKSLLSDKEVETIKKACRICDYSAVKTTNEVMKYICRLIVVNNLLLEDITLEHIYSCYRSKQDAAYATANVLKYMGIIDEDEHYKINNRNSFRSINKIDLTVTKDYYLEEYSNYERYVEREVCSKSNKVNRKRVAKLFLNWIDDMYGYINFDDMKFQLAIDFIVYLRKMKNKNGKTYSDGTYLTMRSQFKMYLEYLINNGKLNKNFILDYYKTDIFNGGILEIIYEKESITKEEINKIRDKIVNFNEYPLMPYVPDILKILFFYGMRPVEAITLRYDCLKGTEESPRLYVHKSKNGEDRYIPLTDVGYKIIKKYIEINKDSLPIYSEFDGQNVKRLFAYRNKLVNKETLNRRLKELEVEASIVDKDGKAKYPLYTLRKIRITLWLEAGLSAEQVAEFVGHRNVESQSYYYISKENRIDSAKKVFSEFYEKFMDERGNIDNDLYQLDQEIEEENYIEELKRDLLVIEEKKVFSSAIEMARKDYPELFFPLMDGFCGAMIEEDGDFECEMLKLPCLECDELKGADENIKVFDKYAINLYKSRNSSIKKGNDGLKEKSDNTIERLKRFYVKKFNIDEEFIEEYFNKLDKMSVVKRGRKKKVNR